METRQDGQVGVTATLELVAGIRQQMRETGYPHGSLNRYGSAWKVLRCFAREVERTGRFSAVVCYNAVQTCPAVIHRHQVRRRSKEV